MRFGDGGEVRVSGRIEEAIHHLLAAVGRQVYRQAFLSERCLQLAEKTWQIGYIAPRPKPYWLATTNEGRILTDESTVADDGGELHLTIEDGGTRIFADDDLNPIYSVYHVSTQTDGSETVMVVYNGRVKTYKGVRKIVADSSDTLDARNPSRGRVVNSTIFVGEGVTSQLEFHGGSGKDSYYVDGGSATAVNLITGDGGDDTIVIGGSQTGRRFRIEGGDGVNRLEGGPGDDEIIETPGVPRAQARRDRPLPVRSIQKRRHPRGRRPPAANCTRSVASKPRGESGPWRSCGRWNRARTRRNW